MGVTVAPSTHDITQLLLAWGDGDQTALEKLAPLVHAELHRLAKRYMAGERLGHLLQTTALVNEAYLRLVDWKAVRWQNRAHFFGVSAGLMRRVLVDFARAQNYAKRGGGALRVSLGEAAAVSPEPSIDLLALDEALGRLSALDARQARVVELRFFGGMELEEIAEALKVSLGTVKRDWGLAKLWLLRELRRGEER
jgi:RNA polymerase sigma factor (TIGR02999 family)